MPALVLRPLEFGEILDHSVELYRRNLACFLGIYAAAAVPYLAVATPLSLRLTAVAPEGDGALGGDLGLVLSRLAWVLGSSLFYAVVVSPAVTGALTVAVSERFLGRPASIASAYRRVFRHLGTLVPSMALVTFPTLLGLLGVLVAVEVLLALGAAWLGAELNVARLAVLSAVAWLPLALLVILSAWVWFGFVPAAAVLEERGWGSLGRSLELVRGSFRRVFGLFLVLLLLVLLLTAYVRLPSTLLAGMAGLGGGSTLVGTLAMQLGVLLVDPIRMVGVTLVYYDLRIRKEGFDLQLLAGELRGAGPAPARGDDA
ncbi:MAG: hypothetical protein HYU66_25095 [Armatimonadetes bacterium]|nr:hypothetical protein [Armatimonadota bacterium]